ncbi:MAG: hypothetical protein H6727_05305 [Myxococcales bacterium]|nr:hypothetical protein [Myxococcales bacterium]
MPFKTPSSLPIPSSTSSLFIACFALVAAFAWMPSAAQAGPSTKRGACGALIPKGSSEMGGRRFSGGGYESLDGLLKFYRKVYGSDGKRYKKRRLFSLQKVTAYHLRSLDESTGWSGINIAFYRNRRRYRLQIYIICRK